MYATVTNAKNKGSSLSMALRAVAIERAVSFTNTALRRGETRSGAGSVVEILKSEFASKFGARYIESFDAGNMSSDSKVGQSQNRERHHSGVSALAWLFNLWWCLKALKPRCVHCLVPTTLQCWLTHRSTGPYTACRQLARHFILGQSPSRCSGPVSSNVSHHHSRPVHSSSPKLNLPKFNNS